MQRIAWVGFWVTCLVAAGCNKSGGEPSSAKKCGTSDDCEGLQMCWCDDLESAGHCHDDKDLPRGQCLPRKEVLAKFPKCTTEDDCKDDRVCLCQGGEEGETCPGNAGGCMKEDIASRLVGSEFFVVEENPIKQMEAIKDMVCQCKDAACVEKAMEQARNIKEPKDLSEDDLKQVFEIAMEMEKCAKVATGGGAADDAMPDGEPDDDPLKGL